MKQKYTSILIIIILFITAPALTAQERITVAVLDFTTSNLPEVYASSIRDRIEVSLYKAKNIDLLERNRIQLAMKEHNIKETECKDAQCMTQLGKLLSATYVVAGNITCIDTCTITIRVIDVQSGRIVYADSQILPQKNTTDTAVKEISARLTAFFTTLKTDAPVTQSKHTFLIPITIGYVQPIGELTHIAKGGLSITTGLYADNIIFKNLIPGVTVQSITLAGKNEVTSIYMIPLMGTVGYNFNLTPFCIITPMLSTGAAYTHIKKPGISHGAIQNISELSLGISYKLSPGLCITIMPHYTGIIERSGVISMSGLDVGIVFK